MLALACQPDSPSRQAGWSRLEAVRKRGLAPECSILGPNRIPDVGCLSPFPDSLLVHKEL